jgi:hypothetical protein
MPALAHSFCTLSQSFHFKTKGLPGLHTVL